MSIKTKKIVLNEIGEEIHVFYDELGNGKGLLTRVLFLFFCANITFSILKGGDSMTYGVILANHDPYLNCVTTLFSNKDKSKCEKYIKEFAKLYVTLGFSVDKLEKNRYAISVHEDAMVKEIVSVVSMPY